jgi:hypothetical protein
MQKTKSKRWIYWILALAALGGGSWWTSPGPWPKPSAWPWKSAAGNNRRSPAKAQKAQRLTENEISKVVVDAAIEIHRELGPGLLESVYELLLADELNRRGLKVE